MKKILALLALSVSLVPFTAAAHGPSPQKVEKSITIKAAPAKVWALVKDFGNIRLMEETVLFQNPFIKKIQAIKANC